MSHYHFDRRDLDFVLYEQLGLESVLKSPRYEDFSREIFDMILTEGGKMATDVVGAANRQGDREGCTLAADGTVTVPSSFQEAWKKYRAGGWVAPHTTPELGGQGLPVALFMALQELFIGANPAFVMYPGLTSAAGHLVEVFAHSELVQRFVPKMYSGEWTGTMCLTEPQAGSSVGDLKSSAELREDGTYSITGTKIFISCGEQDLSDNIIHLVLARVKGDPAGTKGISLFLVPKVWVNEDGSLGERNDVKCVGLEHKMGINGCATCVMSFGEEGECRGYLVGQQRAGIVAMFQMMNEARIICGCQGVAAANAAYQSALAYAKERVQGTQLKDFKNPDAQRVSIIEHPDVRRMLSTMKAYGEGLRGLLLKTTHYFDIMQTTTDDAEKARAKSLLELFTPIVKAYSTDKGFKVTELAIQTYGGYGYIAEYPVEQYMRDVKIASIYEGTNGIQAMDLLGRKMAMNGGALFMTWLQEINTFIETHREHAELGAAVVQLDKAKNALAETAMGFAQSGRQDPEFPMLHATTFLEMFGDVAVASTLLEQAVIAAEKLPNASGDDVRFYSNKIKTASFFAHTILPHAIANARAIKSQNRSALEIAF